MPQSFRGPAQIDSHIAQSGSEPGAGAPFSARSVAPAGHARASLLLALTGGRRGRADPAVRPRGFGPAQHGRLGLSGATARRHAGRAGCRAPSRCGAVARATGRRFRRQAIAPQADRRGSRARRHRRRWDEPGCRPAERAGHDLRGGHPRPAPCQHPGAPEATGQGGHGGARSRCADGSGSKHCRTPDGGDTASPGFRYAGGRGAIIRRPAFGAPIGGRAPGCRAHPHPAAHCSKGGPAKSPRLPTRGRRRRHRTQASRTPQ